MAGKRETTLEAATLTDFQSFVETYQEIAATRMQRVKDSVLKNRDYLKGIESIRREVIAWNNKMPDHKNRLKGNDKAIAVFISANTKLYGDIIHKTYTLFHEYIKAHDTDIMILGRVGLQMVQQSRLQRDYTYYDIDDSGKHIDHLDQIIDTIGQYSQVVVFHGRFEDILNQQAKVTLLRGQEDESEKTTHEPVRHYIFEPSVSEVADFFEQQVLASTLEQTLHEASLSKFTSRMISLDETIENINKKLREVKIKEQWLKHRQENKKQLDALAARSLWKQ